MEKPNAETAPPTEAMELEKAGGVASATRESKEDGTTRSAKRKKSTNDNDESVKSKRRATRTGNAHGKKASEATATKSTIGKTPAVVGPKSSIGEMKGFNDDAKESTGETTKTTPNA